MTLSRTGRHERFISRLALVKTASSTLSTPSACRPNVESVRSFLRQDLRHASAKDDDLFGDPDITAAQLELYLVSNGSVDHGDPFRFGGCFSLAVPNGKRGVEAQPLVVPNVRLTD